MYMKFYACTKYEIQYTCVINNIENSHIENKDKFCNINIRKFMELKFFR